MCSTLCLRLIALACMCILCSASSKCSLSHEAEMIIDITSRRNGTGHWLSQVGVEHGPGQSDSKKWSFGVKYLTSKCDASQDSHTIVVNVVASPARVGPDYVFYPDLGHYKFHPVATTWSRARQICEGEGAHLAVIDSLQEVNKMQEMYTWYPRSTNIGSTDADHAWVGFHDLAIEGNFVTIFGEPFNKSGILRWTSGNPDRSSGLEDCGGFHRSITGGVVDVPCDWKLSFICEQGLW